MGGDGGEIHPTIASSADKSSQFCFACQQVPVFGLLGSAGWGENSIAEPLKDLEFALKFLKFVEGDGFCLGTDVGPSGATLRTPLKDPGSPQERGR